MADKDTPIYDKTRMRGTTWVDATRILFNMGSELEEQVDGMDYEGVKQDLADEIINRQNADTQLGTQVNQNKSDITQIKETINQMEDNATALGASVAELQTDVIEAQADIEGIKTSLVSDVITKGGITTGTIVVEIEREDGTKITAEDFNYGKPTSMELLQGSSEGMMKAQFTLSDGTTIQSNDFQVLEMVTGDLYITSFTFKNGSSQGKISADIGLSDGRTLEANDFQLPTDPQVTQNIASLISRMTAVEEKNSQQDTELSSLDARVKAIEDTPGVGKFELGKLGTIMGSSDNGKIGANSDGTGSVNGWDLVATKDELDNYLTSVPIGGTDIGGVKNGGNVVIGADGTMNSTTDVNVYTNMQYDINNLTWADVYAKISEIHDNSKCRIQVSWSRSSSDCSYLDITCIKHVDNSIIYLDGFGIFCYNRAIKGYPDRVSLDNKIISVYGNLLDTGTIDYSIDTSYIYFRLAITYF